jgi:hypothetical protein
MAQIRLTTTGTIATVTIGDLGNVEFVHPTNNFVIYDTSVGQTEFLLEDIKNSNDLQQAVTNGEINLTTDTGSSIANVSSVEFAIDSSLISTRLSVTPTAGMELLVNDSGTLKKTDASNFLGGGSSSQLIQNIITPPTITGDTHNYNPTGFSTADMIRLESTDSIYEITGFLAPSAGDNRIIRINNISGNKDLKFAHNNSGSLAANRILMRDNRDKAIKENETAIFWYDHISNRWRPLNRIG